MINFIYGRAGSGKTSRICKLAAESLAAGSKVFLIVPEQMAVDAEARMTALLGNAPSLSLEILNFRRLCNRVFREHGGLSYNYVTKSGRMLMMWQTLSELQPLMKTDTAAERGSVMRMLSAVSEFKAYGITPSALERAAKRLESNDVSKKLSDKLYDLSLIYASYVNLVSETCDDAADDLTKAAEILRQSHIFKGVQVYFDSFNGYTPQELAVMREIFRSAENVTVSVCLDGPPDDSSCELFENQRKTAKDLKRMADDLGCEISETALKNNRRAASEELRFLEASLWSLDLTADDGWTKQAPSIRLIECQSLFAECEAVAADILKHVREGAKWRDFTVVARGLERYDGILDVTLEKYGIPHFASKRIDIKTRPLIKLILAALSLEISNFRTADVISYIKTGLCGITPDEVSEIENYAEMWRIRGASRWSSEWEMNPAGYTAEFTERSADKLARINDIRERVIIPLNDLHTAMADTKTVRDRSKALYNYLITLEIPEKLRLKSEKLRLTDSAAAQETKQLWSILIDALDELCTVMPDLEVDLQTYCELLKVIFDETDIGRIPGTVDEVVSGDASLTRAEGKHVYVLGANEGIFPLAPKNDGVFTDSDRETLLSVGVELAGGGEYQSAEERFTFYRALTSASHSVTVVWSASDLSGHTMKPSFGVTRLQALFKVNKTVRYADIPLEDRMEGNANLLEFLAEASASDKNQVLAEALLEYAKSRDDTRDRLCKLSVPLCDDCSVLDAETAELISGGDLALTQSRLDTYVLCHLSYFCKYILKLEEKKPAKFDASSIGTFIHHILEMFVRRAEEIGGLASIKGEDIDRMVDEIVTDYMTTVCRISPELAGNRLAHLFARLKRSSRLLCGNLAAEFSQSRFVPTFFELPIRFPSTEEKAVEPLSVTLDDGSRAYIYGVADRVDILEHGDKLYVRVVDYKTGNKKFSLEDVRMGLNLQMLLYLFSIQKNGASPKNALEYVKNMEIVPAGVLYFSAGVPTLTLDARLSPETVEKIAQDKLARHGLLLDDPEILRAMDKDLTGAYLPIRQKKDGGFTNPSALTSLESFNGLLSEIEATIKTIGKEIKRGNASAKPIKTKDHDACAWCELRPVCRKNLKKGGKL